MIKKTLFFKALALLCLVSVFSCTKESFSRESGSDNADPVSSKLIFTSEGAVGGELLVYFSEDAVRSIEGFRTRAAGEGVYTRSGIAAFDSVLESIGVKSVQRLFPEDIRNEERTRLAGLHRWYVVRFDDSVDLDRAARDMASVSEVSKVEFNKKMRRIGSSKSVSPVAGLPSQTAVSAGIRFNDPFLDKQWHYINTGDKTIFSGIKEGADVNCADAWRLCTGDPRVVVAVVDGGVQWNHPDLKENMWSNEAELNGQDGVDDDGNGLVDDIHGYDFVLDSEQSLFTVDDHGTHVAGTVAAVNNNGAGVCGVAGGSGNNDGVRIMSCQIFTGEGGGDAVITSKAIKYAADNGAAILQCSFGYDGGPVSDEEYASRASAEKQAIDYFIATRNCAAVDGGIVIFAAGNEMSPTSSYPGAYRDFISVTSISCDYTPAYYTNHGPGCNIAAPGGDAYQSMIENETEGSQVFSTITGSKYGYMQGTSMACPHVSGVAALGLSYALKLGKTFTRDQFNTILLTSVNNVDQYCTGTKTYYTQTGGRQTLELAPYSRTMGTGYIDAYQVLMNVRGTSCIPVGVGKQSTITLSDYIGGGDANIKISAVTVSKEDKERLGMSSDPTIFGDRILVKCTRPGSALMSVEILAGTGNGSGIHGMTTTKEFALIARSSHSENGGWL